MRVHIVNNITKVYPDMIKVSVYRCPRVFMRSDGNVKRNKLEVDNSTYKPSVTSLSRTKATVKDIVLCNDFELFCTFTFNPKHVDSFTFSKCWLKMSTWLHHQRDNSRSKGVEFKYLIIPEQHKSGRWHFHALISGYTSVLKDTGLKSASLRPIYNVTSFRSGFTTAVPIDNKGAVSQYVTKYITKDFVKTFNQRRFYCSRNLVRPIIASNSVLFDSVLPIFRKKVAEYDDRDVFEIVSNF